MEDKKIKIHNHPSRVQSILFCGPNNKYIISLDSGPRVSLFMTEWESLTRIHNFFLSSRSTKKTSVCRVSADYLKQNDLLGVCESDESDGGYRISLWEIKNEKLSLLYLSDVEQTAVAHKFTFFPIKMSYVQFATYEAQCIKFWKYLDNKLLLVNRIHVKETVIDSSLNRINSMCYVLTRSGKLFIINDEVN